MASVKIVNGIGFSTREDGTGGGMFINMAAPAKVVKLARDIKTTVPEDVLKYLPWSPWGVDNLLPRRMLVDIETTGILNGIVETKGRLAIGQGIQPAIVRVNPDTGKREIEKFVDDPEIEDFMERNDAFFHTFAWVKDQIGFNWGAASFMMSADAKKIAVMQRDDLTEIRYKKKDPITGLSTHLYYSADWDRVKSASDNRVFSRRLLSGYDPVGDLQEKVKAGIMDHAFTFRNPGWGKHYYPTPLWMAAYNWVKIAQGVPVMKAALFANAMRPKYMVIIHEEYWDNRYGTEWTEWDEDKREEKEQEVYDEIDNWLVGAQNAHKSIFVKGYRDGDGNTITDIEIKPIEDNTKPGELLPDSAAANSEIAFAMAYNNAINGGNQKAGLYQQESGGSNVRESGAMQVMLHELERQQIRRVMYVIKNVNGWAKRLPGLDFVIQANVLTTTDTGGSTKPVVTGHVNEKSNGPAKNDTGN